jgi:hypothetical protein
MGCCSTTERGKEQELPSLSKEGSFVSRDLPRIEQQPEHTAPTVTFFSKLPL